MKMTKISQFKLNGSFINWTYHEGFGKYFKYNYKMLQKRVSIVKLRFQSLIWELSNISLLYSQKFLKSFWETEFQLIERKLRNYGIIYFFWILYICLKNPSILRSFEKAFKMKVQVFHQHHFESFEPSKAIGSGGYGTVYKLQGKKNRKNLCNQSSNRWRWFIIIERFYG